MHRVTDSHRAPAGSMRREGRETSGSTAGLAAVSMALHIAVAVRSFGACEGLRAEALAAIFGAGGRILTLVTLCYTSLVGHRTTNGDEVRESTRIESIDVAA